MVATNKQLLISESRGDSNRCTPYRGNPDQHDTYASCTSPRMPRYVSYGQSMYLANEVINSDGQSHCSREKGLPIQSTARRLTDLWVRTQFLSQGSY
jgi:hypothetical protein